MISGTSNQSGDNHPEAVFAKERLIRFDPGQHIKSPVAAPGRRAGEPSSPSTTIASTDMTSSSSGIHRGQDVVELHGGAERAAMIERMRNAIASGTYDVLSRIDVAAEGLLRDLGESD